MRTILLVLLFAAGCARKESRPEPAFSGRFEQSISLIRAVPPCDSVIGMSWGQTYPVPVEGNGRTRVQVLFYPIDGKGGQANQVYSPVAEAVIDVDNGTALICREIPGNSKKVGDIPAPDPNRGDVAGPFKKIQQELFRRTEAVIPAYYARKTRDATAADKASATAFLEGFEAVVKMERGLLPYYYQANPDFWEWLRKTAGRSIPAAAAN